MNAAEALELLVPPLRGCALCMHSTALGGQLHCACPTVQEMHGLQPVRVVRACIVACGPGAVHMDMTAWSVA